MAGKVIGGVLGSTSRVRKSLKKGGGGQYLQRIKEDPTSYRMATEPDRWVQFIEHYNENTEPRTFPHTEDCAECSADPKARKTPRYLVNAIDVDEQRLVPLVLPKSAAKDLFKFYEKYGTLLDRNYEMSREGSGFDTEYSVVPEAPSRFKLDKFDLLDLMEVLVAQIPGDAEDDDDDEDEPPTGRRSSSREARRPTKVRKVVKTTVAKSAPSTTRKSIRKSR